MEQEKVDDWFKKQIEEDFRPLSEEERLAKSRVWAVLDVPQKERRIFPIWKIAAAILFLLWGGTVYVYQQQAQEKQINMTQVTTELQQANEELIVLKQQLQNLEKESEKQAIYAAAEPIKMEENKIQIIEKRTIIRDTVFIHAAVNIQEKVRMVRDTVFVEAPLETPVQLVKSESNPLQKTAKKRKPKKMQFVFGKPSLPKPQQKNTIRFLNEGQMAKKTKNNHGQLVIPIQN